MEDIGILDDCVDSVSYPVDRSVMVSNAAVEESTGDSDVERVLIDGSGESSVVRRCRIAGDDNVDEETETKSRCHNRLGPHRCSDTDNANESVALENDDTERPMRTNRKSGDRRRIIVEADPDVDEECGERDPESDEVEATSDLPYPDFVERVFYFLDQKTAPRSWCLKLVTWPYPFSHFVGNVLRRTK